MQYKVYEMDGTLVESGEVTAAISALEIPTHGSISIELSDGVWIGLLTSEWLTAYLFGSPITHQSEYDERQELRAKAKERSRQ